MIQYESFIDLLERAGYMLPSHLRDNIKLEEPF